MYAATAELTLYERVRLKDLDAMLQSAFDEAAKLIPIAAFKEN